MHFTRIVTLLLVVGCGSEPKSPVDADPPLLTENTATPRSPMAAASAVSAAPVAAEEVELAKIRLAVDAAILVATAYGRSESAFWRVAE